MPQVLAQLQLQLDEALALIARELPPSECTLQLHVLRHMPAQLLLFGPMRATWMFGFESCNGDLKRMVRQRSNPVANICTRLQLQLTCNMLQAALRASGKLPPPQPEPPFVQLTGRRSPLREPGEELQADMRAWYRTVRPEALQTLNRC